MALKNTQYDSIIRDYNKKQLYHRYVQDKHLHEIYEKLPQVKIIDESISSMSVDCAKKLLNGDQESLSLLKEEIKKLSSKRIQILESNGFPADYLELQYDCKACQDTGYIEREKCHCFKKAAISLLYSQSNIKDILEYENFEHFSYDYFSDTQKDPVTGLTPLSSIKMAVTEARDFIDTFDTGFKNLFFYGNTGVGKTFLSNCIARELIDSFHSVLYFSSFQLFDVLAKHAFHKTEEETSYEYIFDCDLLIIDDLGTELTNSFVSSQLFLCVNERLIRNKSTIISTNLSLNNLIETYSERTFSRISSNYKMIKLTGNDIRIQKKLVRKI